MVKDFFDEYRWDGRPWLMVGMGPSFSHIRDFDISPYNIMGINKVVREMPVDLAHVIDYYIVDRVRPWIETQAKHLILPYFPHFGYRPLLQLTLRDIALKMPPSLKDKLLGYNLDTMPMYMTKSPIIHARYFTAEASLNLIAHLDCKEVYAIGIDGGHERAKEYADHGPCDPRGFDLQWVTMSDTIKHHGITYKNLDGSPLNPNLQELLCPTSSEQKSIYLSIQ